MKKRILLSLMALFLVGQHSFVSASWFSSFKNQCHKWKGTIVGSAAISAYGLLLLHIIFLNKGIENDPEGYFLLVTMGKIVKPLVVLESAFCFLGAYYLCKYNYEKIKYEERSQEFLRILDQVLSILTEEKDEEKLISFLPRKFMEGIHAKLGAINDFNNIEIRNNINRIRNLIINNLPPQNNNPNSINIKVDEEARKKLGECKLELERSKEKIDFDYYKCINEILTFFLGQNIRYLEKKRSDSGRTREYYIEEKTIDPRPFDIKLKK